MLEQGAGGDHNDAHSCQGVGNNQGEDENLLNFDFGYTHYELGKNTMTPTPKVSSIPASTTKVDAVYAVVDKSKKKGAKKKTEDEPTVVNKDDLYAMPMTKSVKMTDEGGGVVVSGGVGTLYMCLTSKNVCRSYDYAYPGNLVHHLTLWYIYYTLSDKQAWAMQVLLQRREFHQHRINLMSSRAVMYEYIRNYYVIL